MRFLLGSSVFHDNKPERVEMTKLWLENMRRMDVQPERTVIIAEGDSFVFVPPNNDKISVVRLSGDLGHIHQHLDNGPKSHHAYTGWSASVLSLAMLAYVNETDFVYKESDCLAFGPWVQRMYRDLGDNNWAFGPKMTSAPFMACQQSLFLVRHRAIPTFVRLFLQHGPENNRASIGENRFMRMAVEMKPSFLSFGVDRMRPIPWGDEVYYFQQPNPEELTEAKRRNLI